MGEHFPNMEREMGIQMHVAQRTPNRLNLKMATPRHIIITLPEVKDKENFESNRRKVAGYMYGNPQKLSGNFSAKTLQARRKWVDILKIFKEKKVN